MLFRSHNVTEENELDEVNKGAKPGWMLKQDSTLNQKIKETKKAYKKLKNPSSVKESAELDESKELAKKYIAKVVDPIHGTPRSSVKLQQRLKGIKLAQRLLQKEGFGQAGLEQRLKKHGIDLNKQAKEWETSAKEIGRAHV